MDKMEKWEACGLEVSALELVVAVQAKKGGVAVLRFPNTAAGHQRLARNLTRGGKQVKVCMEATGIYGLDIALRLSLQEGVRLMVANPRAVHSFAKALMQRSKNDQLDAVVLREFAERMEFKEWHRPSKNTLTLWAIARRLEALTKHCAAEKNRRHAAGFSQAIPGCVKKSIARDLRFHEREIKELREEALRCISADEKLQQRYEQLRSVPGIGVVSGIAVLGEVSLLPEDRDVRQWVAYAGLDPREYSSGTSVHRRTRISKVGNRHLRSALFLPALAASRHDPHLRAFYQHLLARGKKKKQALTAVARKLLHAIYGMFRSQARYEGSRVYTLPPSAPNLIEPFLTEKTA